MTQEQALPREPLLTVAIPCYNSQEYLRRAVESLLPAGSRAELLIVDDGSTDATLSIAQEYAQRCPEAVRALHKENGGHGDAILFALQAARGRYFRVVDSDDWVDTGALVRLLDTLEKLSAQGREADVCITNYTIENAALKRRLIVNFRSALPADRVFEWGDTRRFRMGRLPTIHAITYRTAVLRTSGLMLPKHTFYVDNLYSYQPMALVKTLYYLDVDLYHYFIGRPGQSVQDQVILSRLDQQLRVNWLMFQSVDLERVTDGKHQYYLLRYLEMVTTASIVYLLLSRKKEEEVRLNAFLQKIREEYPFVYRWMCRHPLSYRPASLLRLLPGRPGFALVRALHQLARLVYAFR